MPSTIPPELTAAQPVSRERAQKILAELFARILTKPRPIEWPLRVADMATLVMRSGWYVWPGQVRRWTEQGVLKPREVDDNGGELWHPEHLFQLIAHLESRQQWSAATNAHAAKKSLPRINRERWEQQGDPSVEALIPLHSVGDLLLSLASGEGTPMSRDMLHQHLLVKLQEQGVSREELGVEPREGDLEV